MDSLTFDLARSSLRELNAFLHDRPTERGVNKVVVLHPDGAHNIAVGLDCPVEVEIVGHAGYYAGGMNKAARITITGSAGTGVAENMMSGRVHAKGFASNAAGALMHGGLLVIDGNAGLRCGISLKGGDIVVGGSVGSYSAFMAQAGRMVICGDAGDALGDSLYEAVLYVKGRIKRRRALRPGCGRHFAQQRLTHGRLRGDARAARIRPCGASAWARRGIPLSRHGAAWLHFCGVRGPGPAAHEAYLHKQPPCQRTAPAGAACGGAGRTGLFRFGALLGVGAPDAPDPARAGRPGKRACVGFRGRNPGCSRGCASAVFRPPVQPGRPRAGARPPRRTALHGRAGWNARCARRRGRCDGQS
jgi:hypothetical protein